MLVQGGVIMYEKAYEYAKWTQETNLAPKYVKKQCLDFITIYDEQHKKFMFDHEVAKKIEGVLGLIVNAKGNIAGKPVSETLTGFQWLIMLAPYCVKYRDNRTKRRYSNVLLKISRKNAKSYITALHILLMMLLMPKFSKFYCVSSTGALARESFNQCCEFVKSSPAIAKHFKCHLNDLVCTMNDNQFIPLNYSTSTLDGRLAVGYIADEGGSLTTAYPIEAMRSSQVQLENKLGFIISTAYPTAVNPFEEECEYCKRVLDGTIEDEHTFSLIYEPDDGLKNWETNDVSLYQSSPLAVDLPALWENLLDKRQRAIESPALRENFITKHINIAYTGEDSESYVNIEDVRQCISNEEPPEGLKWYAGVDLAMTNDNTAVSYVAYDSANDIIYVRPMAFIPTDMIARKTKREKVDYPNYIERGFCINCGNDVIDYEVVEDYVLSNKDSIEMLGYDRYNCISSAQKWEGQGIDCIEVKQHSSVLHSPTKWLQEMIIQHKVRFVNNPLFLINFQNARCQYDTNMNMYVNKKRSLGKIDMVVATINALYLCEQNERLTNNWAVC